jgi:hypothetical protein
LQSTGRRRSAPGKWVATRKYEEAKTDDTGRNPWSAVLSTMAGDRNPYFAEDNPSIKAVKKRFAAEQVRSAMRAKTFTEALDHLAPLGEYENQFEGHATKVLMPTKGIMVLWAKAKREGILDQPIESHLPQAPTSWNPEKMTPKHSSYFVPTKRYDGKTMTVRDALLQMASDKRDTKLHAVLSEHDPRTPA